MEKTIEMKGVDLGSFFGPADTNLKLIEKLFSSKIIARGNLIKKRKGLKAIFINQKRNLIW